MPSDIPFAFADRGTSTTPERRARSLGPATAIAFLAGMAIIVSYQR